MFRPPVACEDGLWGAGSMAMSVSTSSAPGLLYVVIRKITARVFVVPPGLSVPKTPRLFFVFVGMYSGRRGGAGDMLG